MIIKIDAPDVFILNPAHSVMKLAVSRLLRTGQETKDRDQCATEEDNQSKAA
jgi:hypothetical protein